MDAERRLWLATVAAACERILGTEAGDPADTGYAAVRQDVVELLARLRLEQTEAAR